MVDYQTTQLDQTFAALADPTRRALLARLDGIEALSVSELAKPFAMSLPAVMKHLDVLSDAGLVSRSKQGRTVTCRLNGAPMEAAMHWLRRYERFWNEQLDRLAAFLEEENPCPPQSPQSEPRAQVLPFNAGLTRRRRKSMPPGPTRKK